MKLNLKIHTAIPRTQKVRFDSELVELFDSYLQFYQQKFNATINSDQAIIEILNSFIKSDRNFMRWFRDKNHTHANRE